MVDMSSECIICKSTQQLNTVMEMKINDVDYKIAICATHENNASPKKIRTMLETRVAERGKELEDLKKMAAKYNLTIVDETKAPVKPQVPPVPQSAGLVKIPSSKAGLKIQKSGRAIQQSGTQEAPETPQTTETQETAEVAEVTEVPDESQPQVLPDGTIVDKHSSYNIKNASIQRVSMKPQVVNTASRGPIPLPSKIFDSTGNTEIKVVNSGGDAALQNRFRSLADVSKTPHGPDFRHSYGVRNCVACGGTGRSRVNKNTQCPKCKGEGIIT